MYDLSCLNSYDSFANKRVSEQLALVVPSIFPEKSFRQVNVNEISLDSVTVIRGNKSKSWFLHARLALKHDTGMKRVWKRQGSLRE